VTHLLKEQPMTIQLNLPPSFAKSWKTTLGGAAAAALGFFQAYKIHNFHDIVSDPTTLSMFVLAVIGFVAKDSNVTGGTSGQPSTAQALLDANQKASEANPPVAGKA
jgi:hypothetical protein